MATIDELKNKLTANAYSDDVAGKLERIEDSANLIGSKTAEFKITEADPYLHEAALALAGVENKGTVDVTLEGDKQSVSLTPGYYEGGTITVGDVSGNYGLETPAAVTPTKSQQNILPSDGYYGIKQVTVNPIPAAYQDVTGVTAGAEHVLDGKKIVAADGSVVTGSMANNGTVTKVLDASNASGEYTNTSFGIAKGYHDGTGFVSIVVEDKTATPTEQDQAITPTAGKVLGKVTVKAVKSVDFLPGWTADATAVAGDIFTGKTAYVNGTKVTGTMKDNADWDAQDHILQATDTGEFSVQVPQGWHDGTGTVKIVAEDKTAAALVPGAAAQTIKASDGKVLHSVIVPALDPKYQDVSGVTATAAQVLTGAKFVNATGQVVDGTMANLGSVATTVDGLAMTSTGLTVKTVGNGFTTGGEIKLDATIYNRLAAI